MNDSKKKWVKPELIVLCCEAGQKRRFYGGVSGYFKDWKAPFSNEMGVL